MSDPNTKLSPKPTMLKVLSVLSNLAILANVAVGFFGISAFVIGVFVGVHTVLRMNYLKVESQIHAQAQDPEQTKTAIAPPMVRNIASVITAVILSVGLYWLGVGVATLAGQFG